ncbi:KICSTOR complex protein SZT2-like isoform X2 [Lycorma delicatula]|uniref:KICSTOR complex protein SZT2-like isoform X2 n=1 Tax=Lycorma delicatula TaxID=130591 RepID=UPI003F512E7B
MIRMAEQGAKEELRHTEGCVLIANSVYLLMRKGYHVSRNVRIQWFLQHINKKVTLPDINSFGLKKKSESELVILSVVPSETPPEWKPETSHHYQYLITPGTEVIFLSETYSSVYCLDMSPSVSTVDIQHGQVIIDEILHSLKQSVEGVVKPFKIPGSCMIFEPEIFVTIIVHTPFFTTPAQQVLVQGWKVTQQNLEFFLFAIQKQLELLEDNIADVSGLVHDQLHDLRTKQAESERLVGGLFEEINNEKLFVSSKTEISMVNPDSGFINLLRYGMLAVRLLPPSNCSNLIVITDGMITLPDVHVLDSVLTQLRTNAVSVSFLHVGSQFHPQCSLGLVPYVELMQFIAFSTTGAYVASPPPIPSNDINLYQKVFLTWSFKKGNLAPMDLSKPTPVPGEWAVSNQRFYGNREPQLLTKKQVEDNLNASLTSVLCCRLREGYTIKSIYLKDNKIEVNLVLPWSNHIYIEYFAVSEWPESNLIHYCISIKAPYEFLHDITCLMKKPFQSPYRQAVVSRFWSTLKTLTQSDLLLAHLDSFSTNPSLYTPPDSIRSGMPLFYLTSNSGPPVVFSNDPSYPQFAHFWRPICVLDPGVWQKWLHTRRLGLILQHDQPFPRFLHAANPNGRFQSLQCRYASSTLYNFLKDWTSCVLIENHSYLKLISPNDGPSWFYITRVISKPPCAVLHVAFLGCTPGHLMHEVIETLKQKLSELKIPQRPPKEGARKHLENTNIEKPHRSYECCILLKKPLEKILIRYERMPSEFGTVVFPDGTQPSIAAKPLRPPSSLVTTLSRYLHHRRWVWAASASNGPDYSLGLIPLARVLATLTEMRLQEGFRFAHSTAGIVNMVLEVQMKVFDEDSKTGKVDIMPCVIQYVLFPPHSLHSPSVTSKDVGSDDDDNAATADDNDVEEGSMELIAECWIEPQHGVVTCSPRDRAYMENLRYYQLADKMWCVDAECISSLLTFEHLRLMCQDPAILPPKVTMDPLKSPPNPLEQWPDAVALADERIQQIPFAYNLLNILPKCQQAQLLFSLFIQEIFDQWETKCSSDASNNLLMEILFENLKELHDRELFLTEDDSKQLMELIIHREKDNPSGVNPIPFTESHVNSSDSVGIGSINSGSNSNDTLERLSMVNDWNRMISWATTGYNCNNTVDPYSSSVFASVEETNEKTSEFNNSDTVYSTEKVNMSEVQQHDAINFIYGNSNKQTFFSDCNKMSPIRWRCYIKAVTATHCILTFVPSSFQDLKALMVQADKKGFKPVMLTGEKIKERHHSNPIIESNLNPEAEPFLPSNSTVIEPQTNCLTHNFSSRLNKSWVVDSLDDEGLEFATTGSRLGSLSSWELSQRNLDPESPLRSRANSWDTMKQIVVDSNKPYYIDRVRTSSVGSRNKYWNESRLKKKQSYMIDNTFKTQSNSEPGSITLPLYTYDCLVSNLVSELVLKSEYVKQYKDIFIDRTWKSDSESRLHSRDNDTVTRDESPEHESVNSDSVADELDLREHSKMVIQSFNTAFVTSLFKSLRLGYNISSFDVQMAVDECEEIVIEINITNYLKVDSTPFGADEIRGMDTSNEYDSLNFQGDISELRGGDQCSFIGTNVWENVGSVTTPEDARTSLLSNMDSDSLSNFPEDDALEDISPLFLHLTCSVRSMGKVINSSINILPTCLSEVLDTSDSGSCLTELDLNDIDVILCLILTAKTNDSSSSQKQTLIDISAAGISSEGVMAAASTTSANSTAPPSGVAVACNNSVPTASTNMTGATAASTASEPVNMSKTIPEKLHYLPEYQQRAVITCIKEIEWLMHDEIAAFLLDVAPVTEETLQFVVNHVLTSIGRSSCLLETIPLHFVYGPEHSMPTFLQDFAQMRLPGYCLKQENDLYYLIKDDKYTKYPKSSNEDLCPLSDDIWISAAGLTGDDKKCSMPGSQSWIQTQTMDVRGQEVDINRSSQTGWSSVMAWQVSSLMEHGIPAEDVYEADHIDETSCDWLTELEKRRTLLPNFWLIMQVNKECVMAYFHCRFLELETQKVKLYSLVQRSIVNNIKHVCKIVNQTMLLRNLHDTRVCDPLLEPEPNDDIWKTNRVPLQKVKSVEDGSLELEQTTVCYPETLINFIPGWFACRVVWETHFTLHPRLKTGPGPKPRLSRGIQALRTVLNRFSVNNRKNMFVYQDTCENVFYLRLHEKTQIRTLDTDDVSPGSVSRSSSINSLNREHIKRHIDEQSSVTNKESRPRLKSFGESGDSFSSRQEDYITLKVHGISEAGPEVKCELVQVLQNRLDDAVLEVVSVMLARNPMCKLSPDDVHFIQKPNHLPDTVIQFCIPTHASQYVQALAHYLRQNLLQFLYIPKYTDSRPQCHFQDYSQTEDSSKRITEDNLFLYNQSPASGNKGIACIALTFVGKDGYPIQQKCCLPSANAYNTEPLLLHQFHTFTSTSRFDPQTSHNDGFNTSDHQAAAPDALVEFRVWKQGRVNMESLCRMLQNAICHSLWDLLMEYKLLTAPLTDHVNDCTEEIKEEDLVNLKLGYTYDTLMVPWLQLAIKLGVPAVKAHIITLAARHPVDVTLKEIYNLISNTDISGFVFSKKDSDEVSHFLNYHFNTAHHTNSPVSLCMIIGRNINQWKTYLSNDLEMIMDKLDLKAQKFLQKFPSLQDTSSDMISFVPRQSFLLTVVSSKSITIYTYNWAKERIDTIKKHIGSLGHWLSGRCNLLTGILAQKMGLFHNQPCTRKSINQAAVNQSPALIADVENLVSFSIHGNKSQRNPGISVSQLCEVFRDAKPINVKKIVSYDPVVSNAQHLIDTKNLEKRDHQKKLYMMWQTRGATPNIPLATDILNLFIQHSRIIHYCLTPLLFLPRWRIQSAATRDHSLKMIEVPVIEADNKQEDGWHQQLCANFVNEYKQYLQTLGFIPIQIGPPTPRKGRNTLKEINEENANCCYLQKSLLGGILLFELFLSEPFFHAKLHALECSRLQGKSSALRTSQFTLSFLDECDRVKVLMHLHSFTYDYHLRCLHWFISDQQALLRPGYHLTSFLDDFLKYYSKAPNYARSLVHAGTIIIEDMQTSPMQVYNYLLSNEKDYRMEVYRMVPVMDVSSVESEYVLVQLSQTPHITYKDAHDMKQTDDFDVTLIVSHDDNCSDQTVLSLKYYLLLTSRRELYPKLEIERKLGKFCTVSIASPSSTGPISVAENSLMVIDDILEDTDTSLGMKSEQMLQSPSDKEIVTLSKIRPEYVNYLGYYSSHEQLMQQLILEQAEAVRRHIRWMIEQGALDCQTHLLWNKLFSTSTFVGSVLTYGELTELCNLAEVQQLNVIDPRLQSILNQPLSWYQGLIKVLGSKYLDHCRTFSSPDNNTQHLLILHPRFLDGFIMLTLEFHSSRGMISVVCRKQAHLHDISTTDLYSLIEGVINACCFHLWAGLL